MRLVYIHLSLGRCGMAAFCGPECQKKAWTEHRVNCRLRTIRLSLLENKGHGLVLTRDVFAGEQVATERPLISLRLPKSQEEAKQILGKEWKDDWGQCEPEVFREQVCKVLVKRAVANLSKEGQRQYRFLSDKESPKTDFGIFLTNALPLDSDSFLGVFSTISRINHSCQPNTYHRWNAEHGEKILHCTESLAAGEELTISYLNLLDQDPSWKARQSYLLTNFAFSCSCQLCTLKGEARDLDDEVRKEASATWHCSLDQVKERGTAREMIDRLLNCFTRAPFSPSIKAPVFLASASLHASSGDGNLAMDHLNQSEHLLRLCKGATSPEYLQLLERKQTITRHLTQNQNENAKN